MGGSDFSFPKNEKLKSREEIREVFNAGKSVNHKGVRLLKRLNGLDYNRITFTFPRGFGNAVERNRSRRLSREAYRHLRNCLVKGYDMVLLHNNNKESSFTIRMELMRELFTKAALLKQELPDD